MDAPVERDGGTIMSAPTRALEYHRNQANAEGWGLFDRSLPDGGPQRIEIRRTPPAGHDAEPRFADDQEAWKHVIDCAADGSALHQAALSLVDPAARMAIEGALHREPVTSVDVVTPCLPIQRRS